MQICLLAQSFQPLGSGELPRLIDKASEAQGGKCFHLVTLSEGWGWELIEGRLQASKAWLALTVGVFVLPAAPLVRVISLWEPEKGKVTAATFKFWVSVLSKMVLCPP